MSLPKTLLQVPRARTPHGVVHRLYVVDHVRCVEYNDKKHTIRLLYEKEWEEITGTEREAVMVRDAFDQIVGVLKRNADITVRV